MRTAVVYDRPNPCVLKLSAGRTVVWTIAEATESNALPGLKTKLSTVQYSLLVIGETFRPVVNALQREPYETKISALGGNRFPLSTWNSNNKYYYKQ